MKWNVLPFQNAFKRQDFQPFPEEVTVNEVQYEEPADNSAWEAVKEKLGFSPTFQKDMEIDNDSLKTRT